MGLHGIARQEAAAVNALKRRETGVVATMRTTKNREVGRDVDDAAQHMRFYATE